MALYKTHCKLCHNAAGFSGTDVFTYTATDGVTSDVGTVTVNSFDPPGPYDDGGPLSGMAESTCAEIPHNCRVSGDADVLAIRNFLKEVFTP